MFRRYHVQMTESTIKLFPKTKHLHAQIFIIQIELQLRVFDMFLGSFIPLIALLSKEKYVAAW